MLEWWFGFGVEGLWLMGEQKERTRTWVTLNFVDGVMLVGMDVREMALKERDNQ